MSVRVDETRRDDPARDVEDSLDFLVRDRREVPDREDRLPRTPTSAGRPGLPVPYMFKSASSFQYIESYCFIFFSNNVTKRCLLWTTTTNPNRCFN